MVSSQELLNEIPSLRRYSRALCGSQKRGDRVVADVLRQLSESAEQLSQASSVKVALFKSFSKNWQDTIRDGFASEQLALAEDDEVDASLALITPLPRQAFLLSYLEMFSADDVAEILELSKDNVAKLIEKARQEIAEQTATTVMIIEDELFIATQLEQIAKDLGHAVLGIARTRTEVHQLLDQLANNLIQPGLVLADIQLADGSSGIDAVNDILTKMQIPVVFITAYPERLLTGRSSEPAYLLNKPFTVDACNAMITQALFFKKKMKSV